MDAEATVTFQVELPAYSSSFQVQVHPLASIHELKHEIARTCTGHPRVDGQRLIHKGRILEDPELIQNVWKVGLLSLFLIANILQTPL